VKNTETTDGYVAVLFLHEVYTNGLMGQLKNTHKRFYKLNMWYITKKKRNNDESVARSFIF